MDSYILKKDGFSILELSIGLLICGILLLMVLMAGKGIIMNAKLKKNQTELNTVAQACREYYQQQGRWPAQVSDLQPFFLSAGINTQSFVFNPQDNIIQISSSSESITVVKPRGLTARLDYR